MSDDPRLKAFDFAQEALKQVLTLGTGALGAAVAILDDGSKPGLQFGPDARLIESGLAVLILSIAFGLFALFNLAGVLERPPSGGITIYKGSIRFFWGGQLLLFIVGLVILTVVLV